MEFVTPVCAGERIVGPGSNLGWLAMAPTLMPINDAEMRRTMDIQLIWIALAIGLGAGMLSGLVGIGGGIVMVPALVLFLQYTQQQAQGTSLAVLTLPVVVLASVHYYAQCKLQGNPIDLRVVGLLGVGFVAGAFVGGRWAMMLPQNTLKQIFAVLLMYTAIRLLEWDKTLIDWIKKS